MKNPVKTIIFIVVAFAIVLIITWASSSSTTITTTPIPEVPTPTVQNYTLAEVAKHSVKTDCWTTISGSVYNLTSFIPNHPGGDKILVVCGKDGTVAFTAQHEGDRDPKEELAKLKIGILK